MNDNTECGCEKNDMYGQHYCGVTPPYHFGNHVCLYCETEWTNN